jgi:hypothetical protein
MHALHGESHTLHTLQTAHTDLLSHDEPPLVHAGAHSGLRGAALAAIPHILAPLHHLTSVNGQLHFRV